MTHKEVLESLLSGQIVRREGVLCDYLYKWLMKQYIMQSLTE